MFQEIWVSAGLGSWGFEDLGSVFCWDWVLRDLGPALWGSGVCLLKYLGSWSGGSLVLCDLTKVINHYHRHQKCPSHPYAHTFRAAPAPRSWPQGKKNPHPSATGEKTSGGPAESSASEEKRAPRMRGVVGRAGGNRLGGEATAARRGCAPGPGSHTELRAAGRAFTSMSE